MKVSVIIPCFNVSDYLEPCFESVLQQDYKNLEIIFVDNNSTDDTLTKLKQFQKYHPEIILLSEIQQGAPNARNKALQSATGEYIQFLDADDILLKEKISSQVSLLEKNNFPDVVIGDYSRFDKDDVERKFYSDKNDIWKGLLSSRLGITSSNLWKRNFLNEVGGWNSHYSSSQEYELLFRILKKDGKLFFDNLNLTKVFDRVSSISSQNIKRNWLTFCDLRIEIIQYLTEMKINESKYEDYYQILFDSLRKLAQYDLSGAVQRFKKHFPPQYFPKKSGATSGIYVLCFKLFGFELSEKIKRIIH